VDLKKLFVGIPLKKFNSQLFPTFIALLSRANKIKFLT
jgi:hypothetical protein